MQLLERLAELFVIVTTQGECLTYGGACQSDRADFEFALKLKPQLEAALHLASEFSDSTNRGKPSTRYAYMPTEPLDYSTAGITMFRQGIRKVASLEITRAYLAFVYKLENRLSDGDLENLWAYNIGRRTITPKEITTIIQHYPGLNEELAGLADLVKRIPEKFFSLLGKADKKAILEVPEYPYMRVLALEQCNRGCGHCAVLSTPDLPQMSYADFLGWTDLAPPHGHLTITIGEPFFWQDPEPRTDLGDIVRHLVQYDQLQITIVTSGINFAEPHEQEAALKMAALDKEAKERIMMDITLSDFPHFRMEGLTPDEARRKAQLDTLRFAWGNGMTIGGYNFLKSENTTDADPYHTAFETEIIEPILGVMAPHLKLKHILFKKFGGEIHSSASPNPFGRALEDGREEWTTWGPSRGGCLFLSEGGTDRVPVTSEGFGDIHYGSMGIGITGDGAVIPGCCTFESPFIQIADMNDVRDRRELKEKTMEFVTRLVRKQYPDLVLSRKEGGGLTCKECMALGNSIRHPSRARKSIGPRNFEDVLLRRQMRS